MQVSYALVALFTAAVALGCQAAPSGSSSPPSAMPSVAAASPAPSAMPESMKGYELYSWQEGGQWRFSLLVGTNRSKTWAEISTPGSTTAATDATAVRDWFATLPRGTDIFWPGTGAVNVEADAASRLEHPPMEVQTQIKAWAADAGHNLTVVSVDR